MKKLFIIIFFITLLLPTFAFGSSDVTFGWDPNTEADIDGYRLYQSDTSDVYTYGIDSPNLVADVKHANVCGSSECQTTIQVEDGKWFWVATAYDTNGLESGPSNEVTDTLDSEPPAPPSNLLVKVIKLIASIFKAIFSLFA